MTTYRITGTFPAGCEGYTLASYASAAGVALDGYETEAAARDAVAKIESTPDVDGIAPTCEVVAAGKERIAAIGIDGMRPVVWGLGATEDEARDDAAAQEDGLTYADLHNLRYARVSPERAARIEAGDVDASDLYRDAR